MNQHKTVVSMGILPKSQEFLSHLQHEKPGTETGLERWRQGEEGADGMEESRKSHLNKGKAQTNLG